MDSDPHLMNLTEKNAAALAYAVALSGDTPTDVHNKALGTWAALIEHVNAGGTIVLVNADGTTEQLTLNAGPNIA